MYSTDDKQLACYTVYGKHPPAAQVCCQSNIYFTNMDVSFIRLGCNFVYKYQAAVKRYLKAVKNHFDWHGLLWEDLVLLIFGLKCSSITYNKGLQKVAEGWIIINDKRLMWF